MFKKDIVVAAGGYDPDTIGEDMEIVVKLHVFCKQHSIPYLIKYAPDAICWSQAPEKLRELKNQRRRWHIGLFQSMWKYKEVFANYKYGMVSFISFLYFLIYELLSPYIELFGILTIILAFAVNLINVKFMINFLAIYTLFGAILTLTAFFTRIHTQNIKLSLTDTLKALPLCLSEIIFLRSYISYVRMTAFNNYKNRRMQWIKSDRQKINIS